MFSNNKLAFIDKFIINNEMDINKLVIKIDYRFQ